MRKLYDVKEMIHKKGREYQSGKIGYILLWVLGVPIPVLFVIYLLRGCT